MLVFDTQYKMLEIELDAKKSSPINGIVGLSATGLSRLIRMGMLCFYKTLLSTELAMGIALTMGGVQDSSHGI